MYIVVDDQSGRVVARKRTHEAAVRAVRRRAVLFGRGSAIREVLSVETRAELIERED